MKPFAITGTYTDLYQISMGQVYFLTGRAQQSAVFDYFFRKIPFKGGYAVFGGVGSVLEILRDFRFDKSDIDYLLSLDLDKDYINFLKNFRFRGTVYSVREGEIVFPNEPLMSVHGTMLEAQLIETMLLNFANFQSLVATKAARMRSVAGGRVLSEFGLRRAQGMGAYHATRAAMIGGFNSSSNVIAARDLNIPVVGTMAHSFIQSYDDELTAFRDFAGNRADNCVLLVDTYDTLRSGVPNAIIVAKEMELRDQRLKGIRLDSGDLAYLSRKAREMLDEAGLQYVTITVSNQLDEYVIKSLIDQKAAIDVFGVGTSLVTAPPDAALDGVYKLAFSNGKPRIKLSENPEKITLPHRKKINRAMNPDNGTFAADVICLADEKNVSVIHHPADADKQFHIGGMSQEPLLRMVMSEGKITDGSPPSLSEIAGYCLERLSFLPEEHKRFENPYVYKVGLSQNLRDLKNELRKDHKKAL